MRLIDEFVKKALVETGSFNIVMKAMYSDKETTYHFMQDNVGKARYIYGAYSLDKTFYSSLNTKWKLVAIVSDGMVYIIDKFFMEVYLQDAVLPEKTVKIDDIVWEKNEYIKNSVFPEFYNRLETDEAKRNINPLTCERDARKYLLSDDPYIPNIQVDRMFTTEDITNMLYGFIDMDQEAKNRLEKDRESFTTQKAINQTIAELMERKKGVENWELEIAEGLRSVDAKTVTVEFELNGNIASGKIEPRHIRRILIDRDYFSGYYFVTTRSGKKLLATLGAAEWMGKDSKPVLTCKNIKRITYGKKELYVRKENI